MVGYKKMKESQIFLKKLHRIDQAVTDCFQKFCTSIFIIYQFLYTDILYCGLILDSSIDRSCQG